MNEMTALEESYGGTSRMEEGEFAGWNFWKGDPYETRSGPFFMRRDEDGSIVSAFRAEDKHMNGGGFLHGGCLMTFAPFGSGPQLTLSIRTGSRLLRQLRNFFIAASPSVVSMKTISVS